ncbi:MAG: hypothetical protein ACRC8S_10860 [Fimbriiglobus sp.]
MVRWLGLVALLACVGCGGSTSSTPATTAIAQPTPEVTTPATTPPTVAAPVPVKPATAGYELDATKHTVPQGAIAGKLDGMSFTPTVTIVGQDVFLNNVASNTQQPGSMMLSFKLPGPLELLPKGLRLVIKSDQPASPELPRIDTQTLATGGMTKVNSYANGYALTIILGARNGTKQSGTIWLSLPDEAKSYVVGIFTASVQRTFDEPPNSGDAPYLSGLIQLPANSIGELEAGVQAVLNGNVSTENVSLNLGPKDPRSARTESEHPTSVVMNSKGEYRFEHIRLQPGRYLMWVRLKPGPAAWKFVTVDEKTALDAPISLDPKAVGAVQVDLAGAKGTIHLIPEDETDPMVKIPDTARQFVLKLSASAEEADTAFAKVPVGRYVALRYSPDGMLRARNPVEVKLNATATVDLK